MTDRVYALDVEYNRQAVAKLPYFNVSEGIPRKIPRGRRRILVRFR
jgi:hypothetical protein